jgi:hypothetical protein
MVVDLRAVVAALSEAERDLIEAMGLNQAMGCTYLPRAGLTVSEQVVLAGLEQAGLAWSLVRRGRSVIGLTVLGHQVLTVLYKGVVNGD